LIVFITGASGVGKTTIVNELKNGANSDRFECYHFDDVGVPSREEMKSIGDWQERTTYFWIDKLVSKKSRRTIIIEGSVNASFITSRFEKLGCQEFSIVLIDCAEQSMIHRLKERNQPELADEPMKKWLEFLRQQAIDLSIPSINTSILNPMESVQRLLDLIESTTTA